MKKPKVVALILTGGVGSRLGKALPKQFVKVLGKPIFIHTLKLYQNIPEVDEMCLVINEQYRNIYTRELRKHKLPKLKYIVAGAACRHYSIRNGVRVVKDADIFVIHDGVRPTTSPGVIKDCIRQIGRHKAASAFIPAFHTIIKLDGQQVGEVLARSEHVYLVCPQVCDAQTLREVFASLPESPDPGRDIPVIKLLRDRGVKAALVQSDPEDIKLTYASDSKAIEYVFKHLKS